MLDNSELWDDNHLQEFDLHFNLNVEYYQLHFINQFLQQENLKPTLTVYLLNFANYQRLKHFFCCDLNLSYLSIIIIPTVFGYCENLIIIFWILNYCPVYDHQQLFQFFVKYHQQFISFTLESFQHHFLRLRAEFTVFLGFFSFLRVLIRLVSLFKEQLRNCLDKQVYRH